jgi:hypothetical protein
MAARLPSWACVCIPIRPWDDASRKSGTWDVWPLGCLLFGLAILEGLLNEKGYYLGKAAPFGLGNGKDLLLCGLRHPRSEEL